MADRRTRPDRCRRLGGGRGCDAEPGSILERGLAGGVAGRLAYNTGLVAQAQGVTWQDKKYSADQLPEFLTGLRTNGVTSLGQWLNLHPAIAASFGMIPIGLLHAPEVVTQQAKFAPGAVSGWHAIPDT